MEIIHLRCLTGLTCIVQRVSWSIWLLSLLLSRVDPPPPISRLKLALASITVLTDHWLQKRRLKNVANLVSSVLLAHGAPAGQCVVNAPQGQHCGADAEKVKPLAGKCPKWDLLNGPEVPLQESGWCPPHIYSVLRLVEPWAKQMGKKATYCRWHPSQVWSPSQLVNQRSPTEALTWGKVSRPCGQKVKGKSLIVRPFGKYSVTTVT